MSLTKPSEKGLTVTQRRALAQLRRPQGFVVIRPPRWAATPQECHFEKRTIQTLVDRGLAEWDERRLDLARRPGANHERREAERTAREAEERGRSQRILELARDPLLLATAVADLEIRLRQHNHR